MKKEPNYKTRFKEMFEFMGNWEFKAPKGYTCNTDVKNMRFEEPGVFRDKSLYSLLEDFMETVYQEGLRDGKCKLCLFWHKITKHEKEKIT